MARIKIEGVLDHLDNELRQALEEAVRSSIPDANYDIRRLYKDFVRAAERKCSTWERIPDRYVQNDAGQALG